MNNDQPEALHLAEFCDGNVFYQAAAAELRRQHAEIARLRAALNDAQAEASVARMSVEAWAYDVDAARKETK